MAELDTLPPEARLLLRRARNARGLSPERIVEELTRSKISGRYWRQIEAGEKNPPDDTLAHMAFVAHMAPEQLERFRPEAAAILREILRQEAVEAGKDTLDPAELTGPELRRHALELLERAQDMLRRAEEGDESHEAG